MCVFTTRRRHTRRKEFNSYNICYTVCLYLTIHQAAATLLIDYLLLHILFNSSRRVLVSKKRNKFGIIIEIRKVDENRD